MMTVFAKSLRRACFAVIGLLMAVAPAAAGTDAVSCDPSLQGRQVAHLLFGRNVEDRFRVSEADWSDFVTREVSPRFPEGFTVVDATGQWRDTRRRSIVNESSKLIEIVLPGAGDDRSKIEAIAEAYKQRFEQQSVGLIIGPACVRF